MSSIPIHPYALALWFDIDMTDLSHTFHALVEQEGHARASAIWSMACAIHERRCAGDVPDDEEVSVTLQRRQWHTLNSYLQEMQDMYDHAGFATVIAAISSALAKRIIDDNHLTG